MKIIKAMAVSAVSWQKVLVNAVLTGLVALLTYVIQYAGQIDLGMYTVLVMTMGVPALTFVKQWLVNYLEQRNLENNKVVGAKKPVGSKLSACLHKLLDA